MLFRILLNNSRSGEYQIDNSVYNTPQLVKDYAVTLIDIGSENLANYEVDFLTEMIVLRPQAVYGFGNRH